jgi:hypothetical protein
MICINLNELYGDRFKVTYEESYSAERGERARMADPWLMILPCKHGHIYPHGGDLLAASTNKRGSVARRLSELACTTVVQDGDDGVNVTFHVRDFDRVAELMRPRRRRRLTDKQRQQAAERLAKYASILRCHPARQWLTDFRQAVERSSSSSW